jgi:hypothetical protein
MPTRKVSSSFLFLMSSEFKAKCGNGWESPATLSIFGIDHPPSADPTDPLPAGLSREDSRQISEFVTAVRDHSDPIVRLRFVDDDTSDASWAAHRATWRKWYKKLSPKVNTAIDKVLDDLETLPQTMLHQQDDDTYPELDNLIGNALNPASRQLFGEFACNGAFLKKEAHLAFRMLLVQTHARHRRSWVRALTTLFGKITRDGTPLDNTAGLWPMLSKDMKGVFYFRFVLFIFLTQSPAELEGKDEWSPAAVKKVLKTMNAVRGPISWTPLLEPEMQAWEALIAGAATAAGLQVEHPLRAVKDIVQDAEEKGESRTSNNKFDD